MKIRADSTEYVRSAITGDHDVTGQTIEVALPTTGAAPTAWVQAEVLLVTDNGNGTWTADFRILLGPAGGQIELSAGTYDWTARLTDNPEVPVRKAASPVTVTVS